MNTPAVPSPTVRPHGTTPAFRLAARANGFRPSAIREILKVTEVPDVISFAGGLAQRVAFVPGEPFWIGPPKKNTLRLNFSNATAARIEEGVARLGRVMAGINQVRPAGRRA